MILDKSQAALALADIEHAERRGFSLSRYHGGAPFLVWGGVVCFTLNLITEYTHWYGVWWMWGFLVWGVGNVVIALLINRHRLSAAPGHSLRATAIGWIAFGLFAGVIAVAQPLSGSQVETLAALMLFGAYGLVGVFFGPRSAIIGTALAALSVLGFYTMGVHFPLYMAVVGGGGLILAGLWLRRV